MLVTVF